MLAVLLATMFFATIALVVLFAPGRGATGGRPPDTSPVRREHQPGVAPAGLYRGDSAAVWAARYRSRTRQLQATRALLHRRWAPTVDYALRLASSVFGVSYWQLRSVAWCESRHNPYARNGQYRGLFQEGPMFERGPFRQFSVFDPVANALTAAHTVSREGWGQWACSP